MGLCSLLVSCLAREDPVLESTGSIVGLMATSKRTYANMCLPGLLLPVPLSQWQITGSTCLCKRPSNTHKQVCLILLWGHCSFLLGLGAHKVWFVPYKSLSFSQSYVSSISKSCWPSKSDFLGIPSLFARSLGWEV